MPTRETKRWNHAVSSRRFCPALGLCVRFGHRRAFCAEEGRAAPLRRSAPPRRTALRGGARRRPTPQSVLRAGEPAHRVFSSSSGEPAAAGTRRQPRHPRGPGPAARWSPCETACCWPSPPVSSARRSARWRHRSAGPWLRQTADRSHRAPCPASTVPPRSGSVPGSRSTTPSPTAPRSPSGSPPTALDSSHPAWGPSSAALPASPTARRWAARPAPAWAQQKAPPSGPASAQRPEQRTSPERAQRSAQRSARARSLAPGPAWAPCSERSWAPEPGRCSAQAQHSAQARRTVPVPAWAQRSAPPTGPASPSVSPRVLPSATVPGSAPPASGRTARRASSS